MLEKIKVFAEDESGLTFVEYGLVASLVSLAGIPVWTFVGAMLNGWFGGIDGDIQSTISSL